METYFPPLLSLQVAAPETQMQAPPEPDRQSHQQQQLYTAALHSVRKPPGKPWRRPEPPPPRVYRVEPRGFRKLVQKLTGAPRPQAAPRPLRETAPPPPPLDLVPRSLPPPPMASSVNQSISFQAPAEVGAPRPAMTPKGAIDFQSPNGFTGFFSAPFYSGWLSPLLSPGTMAALDNGSSPVL